MPSPVWRMPSSSRAARFGYEPCGDRAARPGGLRPYVRHWNGDDARGARAVLPAPTSAISTFVWLLALVISLRRADDGRAGDGRVHSAAAVALQAIPAASHDGGAAIADPREPVVRCSRIVAAVRVRELRPRGGARESPTCSSSRKSRPSISGFFYARLPSLNVLDEMNLRAVKIGWLFLTVGLITGGIWASQLQPSGDPRVTRDVDR